MRHVGARRVYVRARALVHAQLRVGHLQVGERPQAEHRAVEQQRVAEAQQQLGQRPRKGHRGQGGDRRRPRHRCGGRARDARAARLVVVVEVEADERLADPHAQQDARQDHRRQQRFGRSIGFRAHVVGVQRQREQGQALGQDVPELVGRTRGDQALEVAEHRSEATGRRAYYQDDRWASEARTQRAWRAVHASERGRRLAPCSGRPGVPARRRSPTTST